MSARPPTPPSFPIYEVYLHHNKIEAILRAVLPDHKLLNIVQLSSSESYNNRIYLIDLQIADDHFKATNPFFTSGLVLKLVGRDFDHVKVENEVGCLLALNEHCPEVPCPRILAWSTAGQEIETADEKVIEAEQYHASVDRGWILMSRLPGRILTVADLDSKYGTDILNQLAKYIASWRQKLPVQTRSGILRLNCPDTSKEDTPSLLPDRRVTIDGYLLFKTQSHNHLSYYQAIAQEQLSQMKQNPQFQPLNARLGRKIEQWITGELPHHHISQATSFFLTHMDLAPRNILISTEESIHITGILDFEFAGYFPQEEEFINAAARQDDDWEERHWTILMQELAKLGEEVPPMSGLSGDASCCFDEVEWDETCAIARILDRMAPWEIRDGLVEEEDLVGELENAAKVVQDSLDKLRHCVSHRR